MMTEWPQCHEGEVGEVAELPCIEPSLHGTALE